MKVSLEIHDSDFLVHWLSQVRCKKKCFILKLIICLLSPHKTTLHAANICGLDIIVWLHYLKYMWWVVLFKPIIVFWENMKVCWQTPLHFQGESPSPKEAQRFSGSVWFCWDPSSALSWNCWMHTRLRRPLAPITNTLLLAQETLFSSVTCFWITPCVLFTARVQGCLEWAMKVSSSCSADLLFDFQLTKIFNRYDHVQIRSQKFLADQGTWSYQSWILLTPNYSHCFQVYLPH